MNIQVITRNLADLDEPPHVLVIDDQNTEQRNWFMRKCYWAMRNNRSVSCYPTEERVTYKKKEPRK